MHVWNRWAALMFGAANGVAAGFRNLRQRNAERLRQAANAASALGLPHKDRQYVKGHLLRAADYTEAGEEGAAGWHVQQAERRAAKARANTEPRQSYPPLPPSMN